MLSLHVNLIHVLECTFIQTALREHELIRLAKVIGGSIIDFKVWSRFLRVQNLNISKLILRKHWFSILHRHWLIYILILFQTESISWNIHHVILFWLRINRVRRFSASNVVSIFISYLLKLLNVGWRSWFILLRIRGLFTHLLSRNVLAQTYFSLLTWANISSAWSHICNVLLLCWSILLVPKWGIIWIIPRLFRGLCSSVTINSLL